MSDKKELDLTPGQDWQSKEVKPGEPVFGPGALPGLAWFLGFCTMAFIVRVLMG
jgi:hypothetical protein